MKILVVSQYFFPETFRINDLCFSLVKEGHEVTVLTGYPNYPEGYIYPEYKDKKIKKENIQGVHVIRVNMSQRRKNAVSLFLNYITYAASAGFRTLFLERDYDAVFVFEVSPVTQIIPAWLYRLRCGKKLIVNCQDIWPDVVKVQGIKEGTALFSLIRIFSGWLYRRADKIVTSSPGFNRYLEDVCKADREKLHYLPNFAEDFYLEFGNVENQDGKQHLLFAGNIGKAQSLDTVVQAVAALEEDYRRKIMIDIVGDGSYLAELKELVQKSGVCDHFCFHGRKKMSEIRPYYETADGFLLTLNGDSPVSMTIPSKLQGYMGAGKPILAAINGGAKDVIEDAVCGRCVASGDIKGLSAMIKEFVDEPGLFCDFGKNGREYFISRFTIRKYLHELIELMEDEK